MVEQKHRSSPEILENRTLDADHRRLAEILRPGMRVLDVGCGSGAITEGIARAVQPGGCAVGLDRDEGLLERARTRTRGQAGLEFVTGSILDFAEQDSYDIATAARALQWIPDVPGAVERMVAAVRPGGTVVILDYDHDDLEWRPTPPASVRRFYSSFLAWRHSNGWDNRMGSNLPRHLQQAGLAEVTSIPQNETFRRGQDGFEAALRIWAIVMTDSQALVSGGELATSDASEAIRDYEEWCRTKAQSQTMVLTAVEGRRTG